MVIYNFDSRNSSFAVKRTYSWISVFWYVEIKCQLSATNGFFIADLIACSTCFGHHYAHHQELKGIIQWLLPVVFRALVFNLLVWCGYVSGLQDAAASYKPDTQHSALHQTGTLKTKAPNITGSNHLYNTLELLMMGIMMPETRWASNKICNKETICCI